MSIHEDKSRRDRSQFTAINNSINKNKKNNQTTSQFIDNRPEMVAQRQLQEIANNSPQSQKAAQFQEMANSFAASQTPIIPQKENNTGLPDNLKSGIEQLSGYSMDDVNVHYNSDKPAQLNAHAYAQGTDIHLGAGQEKHLPHEAWHVVQQKQGRVKPTMQMKEKFSINDDAGLEKEADVMGTKAMQMYRTSFYANELTEPVELENGNSAQLITIQKNDKGGSGATEKPAKLHIHADLDAPGMTLIKQLLSGQVGHAWISLEWKDSTNIPADIPGNHRGFLSRGGTQADPMGFWPKMFASYNAITEQWSGLPDDQRESYSSNPFDSYVGGQMVHPDNIHSPKATQSYDITHEQAKAVINYTESKRGAQYSVFYYNCTTFAKEAAKAGGQSPPSMGMLGICYPDALYKSIVANQKKKKGTTTVYDDAGVPNTVVGSDSKKK